MEHCTCGDKAKRKLYTNDCLECGKSIVFERDLTDVYKFRAECLTDVTGVLNNLWPGHKLLWVKIGCSLSFPDCDVEAEIVDTDLEEIRIALSGVPDAHVMIETLNYSKDYTGERWFRGEGA